MGAGRHRPQLRLPPAEGGLRSACSGDRRLARHAPDRLADPGGPRVRGPRRRPRPGRARRPRRGLDARPVLRGLEHAGDGRAAVRLRRPLQPRAAERDPHDGHLRERAHADRARSGRRRSRGRDQAVHRRRDPRQAGAARPASRGGPAVTTFDTGERRRAGDTRRVVPDLIDEPTVLAIAEEAWISLVGEDEILVPLPGERPADPLSSWVDVVGPWTGSVVLSTGVQTAAALTRALLGDYAPELLEHEDVADAFGEIANVVGGNVKAALPGPSALSLPEVGNPPAVRNPADVVRIDVLWRGQPVSISVQGALPPLPVAHH